MDDKEFTVKSLIEELKKYPPECTVVLNTACKESADYDIPCFQVVQTHSDDGGYADEIAITVEMEEED